MVRQYVKQVIVIRKDLKMPPGKLAAQVAHASLGAFIDSGNRENYDLIIPITGPNKIWLDVEFTKICLMVNSEKELLDINKSLLYKNIPKSLVRDAGHTVFKEPTYTCLGIGPWHSEDLDKITGHLKLYR